MDKTPEASAARARAWPLWQKIMLAAVILAVLGLAFWGIRHLTARPRPPATAQEVENARLARVAKALKDAHAAKASEKWQVCLEQATLALELETGVGASSTGVQRASARVAIIKEATDLRDEAEVKLMPPIDPSKFPKLDAPWENSLGMQLVPVKGTEVLFAVLDITNGEYKKFQPNHNSGEYQWQSLDNFHQPVVSVTWEDAKAYCAWLTRKERKAGLIGPHQTYRLPKDWEWSVAAGLKEPREGTPKDKDELSSAPQNQTHSATRERDSKKDKDKDKDKKKDEIVPAQYAWGPKWPPPREMGNLGASLEVDDFPVTSPVGSFKANMFGLSDMLGNVWQWCEDFYDGKSGAHVMRGGSWGVVSPRLLRLSFRFSGEPGGRDNDVGFRIVLAPVPTPVPVKATR